MKIFETATDYFNVKMSNNNEGEIREQTVGLEFDSDKNRWFITNIMNGYHYIIHHDTKEIFISNELDMDTSSIATYLDDGCRDYSIVQVNHPSRVVFESKNSTDSLAGSLNKLICSANIMEYEVID